MSKASLSTRKKVVPAPKVPVRLTPRQKLAANVLRTSILQTCANFEAAVDKDDKDYLRALHSHAKREQPGLNPALVSALFEKHKTHFRLGAEIDPEKIKPVLRLATDRNEWSEIFLIVRALWSMPYNKGYGRRLRFVVYDEFHGGVIGIIGLQSPPADLNCRDALFDYPEDEKLDLVNTTMDAFAVGAVPPYSYLLGGKLCAGLISTDAIRQAYWLQYAGQKTEMLKKGIRQPLAAVTTTSAFGRSSMYNRLRYFDHELAEPIGFTLGFGTLHLEHLYGDICTFLKARGEFTEGGFGNGPKVRWQNITNALMRLDLPTSLLKHGVKREVFLYRLVDDLEGGMAGGNFGRPLKLSVKDFGEFWRDRWAIPRAETIPTWSQGNEVELIQQKLKQEIPG